VFLRSTLKDLGGAVLVAVAAVLDPFALQIAADRACVVADLGIDLRALEDPNDLYEKMIRDMGKALADEIDAEIIRSFLRGDRAEEIRSDALDARQGVG
jgi:hypothetical protein